MKRMINSLLGRSEEGPGHVSDIDLPHSERVKKWGHRRYIGGTDPEFWYGIGRHQYHYLVSMGLRPDHVFLDVACGSLRLGQYIIPMLDKGNYFGIEGEQALIDAGVEKEMDFDVVALKEPTFMCNYEFDVSKCPGYDFAIAQSLFTHLTIDDIAKCFNSLYPIAKPDSQFFFTFFEGDESENEHSVSHANLGWNYQFGTIEAAAKSAGFDCEYVGHWNHPRNQMMAIARKPK